MYFKHDHWRLLATLADRRAVLSEDFGISSADFGNIVVVGALYSEHLSERTAVAFYVVQCNHWPNSATVGPIPTSSGL